MQRILRTFPKVLINPAYTWTVVPSRAFARGRKPVEDPNKEKDEQMNKLWNDLENTEFGRQFDSFIDKHIESGRDENDLIQEYLAPKISKKDMDKLDKNHKASTAETAGEAKAVDLKDVTFDSNLEKLFMQEMNNMNQDKRNQMMNDFNDFFQALNTFSQPREQNKNQQQEKPKISSNKPSKAQKASKKDK